MKKGAGMALREQWERTRELFRAGSRGDEEWPGQGDWISAEPQAFSLV